MVRIIAGEYKGCNLFIPPASNKIRPTSDRVKESIFSTLRPYISGATVLDLFCGSGNLGLEALSEGACRCYFVEKDAKCIEFLKRNIEKMRLNDRAHILACDVYAGVISLSRKSSPCTIVFADPPYDRTSTYFAGRRNLLIQLIENDIVAPLTIFVLEHSVSFILPDELLNFEEVRTKRYGATAVTMLRCNREGVSKNETETTAGGISG
jgi:16S rRNA (guanine(966)-N(2))-methyltransferase RsmD